MKWIVNYKLVCWLLRVKNGGQTARVHDEYIIVLRNTSN
jgi:hypothetical protein